VILKFARCREIFSRGARLRLCPQRFTLFAAVCGRRAIERDAKRDAHEPRAKTGAIAQTSKSAVSAQHRILRDVFSIGAVAQYSARDAECQRTAFGEVLFKLATQFGHSLRFGFRVAASPLVLRRGAWA